MPPLLPLPLFHLPFHCTAAVLPLQFVHRYSWSAVGLNFLLSAMALQWSMLTIGFFKAAQSGKWCVGASLPLPQSCSCRCAATRRPACRSKIMMRNTAAAARHWQAAVSRDAR